MFLRETEWKNFTGDNRKLIKHMSQLESTEEKTDMKFYVVTFANAPHGVFMC